MTDADVQKQLGDVLYGNSEGFKYYEIKATDWCYVYINDIDSVWVKQKQTTELPMIMPILILILAEQSH